MLKVLLYPLSLLYGFAVLIRNRAYDLNILKSTEFEVPVISIGNISVGGTGKTPHVEYLVELLKEKYKLATLSRGYKRKTKGFRLVEASSTALEVGDEPLQIKNKFRDVTVSVCENRVTGVETLMNNTEDNSYDVVLLDDAFQHRRITPGINILLINYNQQLKDDFLLPLGRLRERAYQMRRANIIIFTKCPEEITPIMRRILQNDVNLKPYQELFFTKFDYGNIIPVFNAPKITTSEIDEKKLSVLMLTGIASPELMEKHVKKLAGNVELLTFPDHHNFKAQDLKLINEKFEALKGEHKIIITTEKDSMRLKGEAGLGDNLKDVLYYLPIKVSFHGGEEKLFNKKILNYVGENKSNRELHKRKNSGKA